MAVVQQMGSTNIYASVLGVRFADGTTQTTAASGLPTFPITNEGSALALDAAGVILNDPFGGLIHTSATDAGLSAANSGGGFSQFFNGTVWVTAMGDGNGNGLFLGPLFTNQQINLSNSSSGAGMINTIGDTNFLYGNPLFLGVSGGVGITISPAGISLNGIGLSLTPPTAGQVLTASSPTAAEWVTPAGGGSLNYKVVRSAPTAFTQGGVVGPIVLSFATPFADNNYTLSVTVEGDEAAPGTPTLTQYPSVGISYIVRQAGGAGVTVWVSNNDSIAHTGVISVVAIHD